MAAEDVSPESVRRSPCRSPESLPRQVVGRWMQAYGWVLQSHERAAYTMFAFLALAAGANTWSGFKQKNTTRAYAWTYGAVGAAMVVVGLVFVVLQHIDRSILGGHLILSIEAAEILLFVIFWSVQTVERWNGTV